MDGQGAASQRALKTRDTERYAGRHGDYPPIRKTNRLGGRPRLESVWLGQPGGHRALSLPPRYGKASQWLAMAPVSKTDEPQGLGRSFLPLSANSEVKHGNHLYAVA